jgi:heterodisulfide reductase subunit A
MREEVVMENGKAKIGVYVCHCGSNIAKQVDVEEVVLFAKGLPHVAKAVEYKFMCSEPGQDLIKDDIREQRVNRVVIAACSPLMHEATFRKTVTSAGLNQYLVQIANIREQCAWVTADKKEATDKAKALVNGAIRKAELLEPLETRKVDIDPATLIVGGGIAGIQAALDLAEAGKKVYLVERDHTIGGKMARFDKTFPTLDCAACILTPKMVNAGHHDNITIMSSSDVVGVSGHIGSFQVKIKQRPRYVDIDKCTACASCWNVCPATKAPVKREIRRGGRLVKRLG